MDTLDDLTQQRLNDALRCISRHVQPVAAYLFGSRAEGRADRWSDYDIAVFVEGAETWDMFKILRLCREVQKEAGYDIEVHVFAATQAEHPEPAGFASHILAHGIRLPLDNIAA